MADEISQTVLRCTLCNKPFDKHSTLKRHGYYCRSRNSVAKVQRSRSCVTCVKAKARCDNRIPTCTRCATKNVECRSQVGSSPDSLSPRSSGQKTRRIRLPGNETPTETSPSFLDIDTLFDGNGQGSLGTGLTNYGTEHFGCNLNNTEILEFQELDSQVIIPDTLAIDYSGSASGETYRSRYGAMISTLPASIPAMPTYRLRSFAQRPAIKGRRQMTARLMVNILTSYPMMFRSPETLPLFIHPYSLSRHASPESKSSSSLTTCMNLMQMISTNMPGSRKLLWKNVRLECERLQEEWCSFDRWELLSSMQAILVYVLLRLQEGETMDNNFDVLLLATAWVVAKGLNQAIGNIPCDRPCGVDLGGHWDSWVFEESRRRLAVTFGTMCMLFSMEPSSDCVQYEGFLLTPLPARKQLWEAHDEKSWALEKSRDNGLSIIFGIMSDGQMAKLDESHAQTFLSNGLITMEPISAVESDANWQQWCSGMDGLGALIMLAASLPGLCP